VEFIGDLERAFASAIYPNRLIVAIVGVVSLIGIGFLARRRRWDLAARRHPGRTLAAGLVTLVLIGPIGWYLASPLFLSTSINEPPPVAAGDSSPTPGIPASADPSSEPSESPTSEPLESPIAPPPLERTGSFTGADDFHFGEGTARLIETAPGLFSVRLEDFAVRNGPDLYVYLSPDAGRYPEGSIELGRLKADRGNQNYEVPANTDMSKVESVVIWCKQFSVLFATAELS
jgi:hypothetical protein